MLKWLNKDLADVGKVGITFGAMDLLHGGHIAMLAEAKRKCDYLVVGLQNDPSGDRDFKNAPVQSLFERQLQLSAVRYVCLLYTSPSPRDLSTSRMPSSA